MVSWACLPVCQRPGPTSGFCRCFTRWKLGMAWGKRHKRRETTHPQKGGYTKCAWLLQTKQSTGTTWWKEFQKSVTERLLKGVCCSVFNDWRWDHPIEILKHPEIWSNMKPLHQFVGLPNVYVTCDSFAMYGNCQLNSLSQLPMLWCQWKSDFHEIKIVQHFISVAAASPNCQYCLEKLLAGGHSENSSLKSMEMNVALFYLDSLEAVGNAFITCWFGIHTSRGPI